TIVSPTASTNNNGVVSYTLHLTSATGASYDTVATAQVTGSFSGTNVVFNPDMATLSACPFIGQSFTCPVGNIAPGAFKDIMLSGTATESSGKKEILNLGNASTLSPQTIRVGPATVGDYNDPNS